METFFKRAFGRDLRKIPKEFRDKDRLKNKSDKMRRIFVQHQGGFCEHSGLFEENRTKVMGKKASRLSE